MIKACDAYVACKHGKPNRKINFTEKMKLLRHYGLIKYSMFSAPDAIIGIFATFEG